MIINVAPQASIATTPNPSSPEEGTTLGARYCSGRHGGLPLHVAQVKNKHLWIKLF
jgi:hypothetical protein